MAWLSLAELAVEEYVFANVQAEQFHVVEGGDDEGGTLRLVNNGVSVCFRSQVVLEVEEWLFLLFFKFQLQRISDPNEPSLSSSLGGGEEGGTMISSRAAAVLFVMIVTAADDSSAPEDMLRRL